MNIIVLSIENMIVVILRQEEDVQASWKGCTTNMQALEESCHFVGKFDWEFLVFD